MKKKAMSAKKKKKPAVKAKAKPARKKAALKTKSKTAKSLKAKSAKTKSAKSTKAKSTTKKTSKTRKSPAPRLRTMAEKAKMATMANKNLQTASGASKKQPNPAKGPKLTDPRSKESQSSQAVEPVISDPTVPQGAPIPEATAEGVAPHGIPYKSDEHVSQHAMNEKAEIAQALRYPRGTSTHTYASPGHSRDSSSRKQSSGRK